MALLAFIDLEPAEIPAGISIHIELVDSNGQIVHFQPPPGSNEQHGAPVMVDGTVQAFPRDETPYHPEEPVRVPFVVQLSPGIVMDPGIYRFRAIVTRKDTGESVEVSQYFRVREPGESRH
jgi:hypothetical protein